MKKSRLKYIIIPAIITSVLLISLLIAVTYKENSLKEEAIDHNSIQIN